MADISMCMHGCKLQDTCYRFKAPVSSHWQSYAMFAPDETGVCHDYWEIKPVKTLSSKSATNKVTES